MDHPVVRRFLAGYLLAQAIYTLSRQEGRQKARTALASALRPPRVAPAQGRRRKRTKGSQALRPIRTERLFGHSVAALDQQAAIARLIAWSDETPARTVLFADAGSVFARRSDGLYARALERADLTLADGAPFAWLSEREGGTVADVDPAEFARALVEEAARNGRSIFIAGREADDLVALTKRIKAAVPAVTFAGAYPFTKDYERDVALSHEILTILRTARPDLVLLALPRPGAELLADGLADGVRHGVFVSLGGALAEAFPPRHGAAKGPDGVGFWTRLRFFLSLPVLLLRHDRDRSAHERLTRRQAIAALSDRRYREARRREREAERERALLEREDGAPD